MLVGSVAPTSPQLMPFAFYYMGLFDELGMEYEVIVPDHCEGLGEGYAGELTVLPWNKKSVSLNYILFSRAVKKILATISYHYQGPPVSQCNLCP